GAWVVRHVEAAGLEGREHAAHRLDGRRPPHHPAPAGGVAGRHAVPGRDADPHLRRRGRHGHEPRVPGPPLPPPGEGGRLLPGRGLPAGGRHRGRARRADPQGGPRPWHRHAAEVVRRSDRRGVPPALERAAGLAALRPRRARREGHRL
ncbi:MAG: hypothetical protein AVDCRST_MAG79-2048, partial [uncultured Thermoleophilia bacterium]